jgi:hypothetical protein
VSTGLVSVDLTYRDPAYLAATVDEIERWPIVVVEGIPVRVIVVEEVREVEPLVANVCSDGIAITFVRELRGMNAHDRKAAWTVSVQCLPDPGNGVDAVDSAERPDVQ